MAVLPLSGSSKRYTDSILTSRPIPSPVCIVPRELPLMGSSGSFPGAMASNGQITTFIPFSSTHLFLCRTGSPPGYPQSYGIRDWTISPILTEEVTAAQDLGAGKYIKKPYNLEKIGVAVKEELEK